ncbi:MAG: GNAT family N-acetyltransferase [Planctomycetota bacterium]
MRVRRYVDADLERVTALFTRSVHALSAPSYDEAQREAWAPSEPALERFRARFAAMTVLLAESGDDLLGFIGFEADGHVDFLYTSPDHARLGVATRLHDEAAAALRERGVSRLYTEASEAARPFFERQGYAVVEREVVTRGGVELPRYRMRRARSGPVSSSASRRRTP